MARHRTSRSEERPQRLFVAVAIPGQVAKPVEAAVEPWRAAFPKARWIPQANWHVTLQFLGPVYPRLVPWVRERLGEVAVTTAPFDTRVHGLGAFPSARRARVLWAGLDGAEGRLEGLATAVQRVLAPELPLETRPFAGHLTIARSDQPIEAPEGYARSQLESERFTVGSFVLMRTHIERPSPFYEPLEVFLLQGGAGTSSQ